MIRQLPPPGHNHRLFRSSHGKILLSLAFDHGNNHLVIHFHAVKFCTANVSACLFLIYNSFKDLTNFLLVQLVRNFLLMLHDLLRPSFLLFPEAHHLQKHKRRYFLRANR